jgi:hypothetical protein
MAAMRYWRAVLQGALLKMKNQLARNPSEGGGAVGASHSPVAWASRAQQVAYVLKRKRAGLPLKYARGSDPQSETLLKSWTTQVAADGRSGLVGSRASYGPYVMDEDQQTRQHELTGWGTIQDVAREEGPDIIEALIGEIDDMVERAKR